MCQPAPLCRCLLAPPPGRVCEKSLTCRSLGVTATGSADVSSAPASAGVGQPSPQGWRVAARPALIPACIGAGVSPALPEPTGRASRPRSQDFSQTLPLRGRGSEEKVGGAACVLWRHTRRDAMRHTTGGYRAAAATGGDSSACSSPFNHASRFGGRRRTLLIRKSVMSIAMPMTRSANVAQKVI